MSSDGSWSYGSFGNTSDIWLQASIYSGGDANHGFRVIDNYGNGEVLISIDGTGNTNVQTLNATGNIFSGNIKLVSDVIAGGNVSAAGNVQVSNNMSANSFMSTSALYMNYNSITENTTLQSGYNSMSAGPMQIPNGITFTAEPGARWTVA
jgi:hypothetical protein